jgi:hypothetical protein
MRYSPIGVRAVRTIVSLLGRANSGTHLAA